MRRGFLGRASGKEPTCQCRRQEMQVGKIPWRRAWQPILVLLLGKFHGQRNLAGCGPWSCKESDTTEAQESLSVSIIIIIIIIIIIVV